LIPPRLVSADQLGLSRDIQALAGERDGLILVAGPRLSGKSTLISALVDLINRNRSDYVITLETDITFIHESRKAIVSQREVRGDVETMAASARAALRENPDVLVIDDLRSADPIALALEAADSGHLVIGCVTAHTTMTAIARLIESGPTDRQTRTALALSEMLRGAVAQVLLRKTGGGRVAARELLLNTASVAALLAEGKVGQLSLAIDSGRKYGMVPLNDALAAFVQSGAVDAREAYRKAYDRVAFLEQLKRDGIDTSFVERLA
jgi:twitching motility protein PilT